MVNRVILIGITLLVILSGTGCEEMLPAPTPTADWLSTGAVNEDCGDILTVSLHSIQVRAHQADHTSDTGGLNQVQALVLLADRSGEWVTRFNYHPQPVSLTAGAQVTMPPSHAGIDIGDRQPVYVWIMVVDSDEPGLLDRTVASGASAIVGQLITLSLEGIKAGVPFVLVADFAWNVVSGAVIEQIEQPDILGDFAFLLDEAHGWGVGSHTIEAPNGAVVLDFDIAHYPTCQTAVAYAPPPPQLARRVPIQCSVHARPSRVAIGDMVVVTEMLFFREGPAQSTYGVRFAPGHIMRVIGGPQCDRDILYWKVLSPYGREGWMAEMKGGSDYYLRPMGTP